MAVVWFEFEPASCGLVCEISLGLFSLNDYILSLSTVLLMIDTADVIISYNLTNNCACTAYKLSELLICSRDCSTLRTVYLCAYLVLFFIARICLHLL